MMGFLMACLAFGTLGVFTLLAVRSAHVTDEQLDNPSDPPSTLASDGPDSRD